MNYNASNVLFILPQTKDIVRALRVQYENKLNAATNLAKTMDPTIKVGDLVVVQTTTRWEMTVSKVVATDVEIDFYGNVTLRWCVSKVDLDAFDKIKKLEDNTLAVLREGELESERKKIEEKVNAIGGDRIKNRDFTMITHVKR